MKTILFCLLLVFGSVTQTSVADRPVTSSGVLLEVVVHPKDYRVVIYTILTQLGVDSVTTKIIVAQAMHESGNFESNIFMENNNCFGMKQAKIRPNLATGTNRGHATYNTVEEGIIDYYLWMLHFKMPQNERNLKRYVNILHSKNYFGDDKGHYYRCVKSKYKDV